MAVGCRTGRLGDGGVAGVVFLGGCFNAFNCVVAMLCLCSVCICVLCLLMLWVLIAGFNGLGMPPSSGS